MLRAGLLGLCRTPFPSFKSGQPGCRQVQVPSCGVGRGQEHSCDCACDTNWSQRTQTASSARFMGVESHTHFAEAYS